MASVKCCAHLIQQFSHLVLDCYDVRTWCHISWLKLSRYCDKILSTIPCLLPRRNDYWNPHTSQWPLGPSTAEDSAAQSISPLQSVNSGYLFYCIVIGNVLTFINELLQRLSIHCKFRSKIQLKTDSSQKDRIITDCKNINIDTVGYFWGT